MATQAPYTFLQYLDNNGDPLNGGFVYSYEAGTTTPLVTYTDQTENTANANPVVLDANGRADIWLGTGNYKLELRDSEDTLIKTVDNIAGQSTGGIVSYDISTNTAITELYDRANIIATGTTTLSLLPAADATDGFSFYVFNNGSGLVTIDPDGAETINDATTVTIVSGGWARVVCDGDEWNAYTSNNVLNNLNASTAPTVNDDTADGYAVGSKWYDTTNDEAYVCLDASSGAAVWVNTTLESGDLGSAAIADLIDDDTFATATSSNVPSAESVKAYVDNNQAFSNNLLHVREEQAANTAGGGFTSGAWQTRILNTTVTNEISGASLASNQITLPAGDYYIEAFAPAFRVNGHKVKLYNDSDSADIRLGSTEWSSAGASYANTRSNVFGKFTLAAEKDLELQHRCETTRGTDGFGLAANVGATEVYAEVRIWKL